MSEDLAGRVAVVSGAARGIGRALAFHAARQDMIVHAWDLDIAALRDVHPNIFPLQVDVADATQVHQAAAVAKEAGAEIGMVFANAGLLRVGRSWEIDPDEWSRLLAVNVGGVANMLCAFVPALLEQRGGSHIVITASQSAFAPRPGNAAYSGTKHALWGIAEALKLELEAVRRDVGVSVLAPGPVRTDLAAGAENSAAFHRALQDIGMDPDKVAERTFGAVRQGKFWIFTHEDFKEELRLRIDRLLAEGSS